MKRAAELNEGTYVRVIGNLKAFGTKRSLQGFRLIPIVDFNELTHHFLEVPIVVLVKMVDVFDSVSGHIYAFGKYTWSDFVRR